MCLVEIIHAVYGKSKVAFIVAKIIGLRMIGEPCELQTESFTRSGQICYLVSFVRMIDLPYSFQTESAGIKNLWNVQRQRR